MSSKIVKKGGGRTIQITIRLEPKILQGLQDIGERLGIAHTTLAGIAIGEYVSKAQAAHINAANAQTDLMKELAHVIGGPMASMFTDKTPEELDALLDLVPKND